MLKALISEASPSCSATNRRVPPLLIGALVFTCCIGCDAQRQRQQQQQKAMQEHEQERQIKETASTFLKSIPQLENQAKWGLEKSTLFGPGVGDVSKLADSPLTYDAVAEVWCEGNTIEGHPAKLVRTVVMKVAQGQDSKWRVTDYSLTAEEPLSYWKQVAYWVLWSFLVPLVVLSVIAFGMYVVGKFAEVVQWQWLWSMLSYCLVIVVCTTIYWWIEVAFKSFGSWLVAALFWTIPLSILGFIGLGIRKARQLTP